MVTGPVERLQRISRTYEKLTEDGRWKHVVTKVPTVKVHYKEVNM